MKKSLSLMIILMVAAVAAGGVFLWYQNHTGEEILDGLDPESYDVEATCIGIEGNNLICNAGGDRYLYLDGSKVFLRKYDVEIDENGDEKTKISYEHFSLSELLEEIEKEKEVPVVLWLTQNGKVKTIMAGRESFENHNASLSALEGLDPNTSTASCVILSMDRKGLELAPAGYTPETADKFKDFITEYSFAKHVKFYRETVTVTVKPDGKRQRNVQYGAENYRSVKDKIGAGAAARIWINGYGNIYAVLLCEEKVILE